MNILFGKYLNYCEAAFLTRNINLPSIFLQRDQNMI